MIGFYIEKLIYTGKGVVDVSIDLKSGVNAIYGPSDTGKTYIFKSIDFMFGKVSSPKSFKEGEAYTTLFMIINIGGDSVITLKRELIDKSKLHVYRCKYEEVEATNAEEYSVSASAKKSISSFYMNLLGVSSKLYIVENDSTGVTKQFSIRYLIKYFMLNEGKMIEEENPPIFVTSQHSKKVFDKNAFNYLISNINETEKITKTQNDSNRKIENQLELIDTMISENSERFSSKENEFTEFSSFDVELILDSIRDEIEEIQSTIKTLSVEKMDLEKYISSMKVKQSNLSETVNRFLMLDQQYQNEIERYQFIYEGNYLIDQLPKRSCPVCNNDLKVEVVDTELMYDAMVVESKIIKTKQKDLRESIRDLSTEINALSMTILQDVEKVNDIEEEIRLLTNIQLSRLNDELNEYIKHEQLLTEVNNIRDELRRLEVRREQLQSSTKIPFNGNDSLFLSRSDIISNGKGQLCQMIAKKLEDWIYHRKIEVEIDEDNDLIIDGKSRKSFGKGYRSLIHTAYYLSFFDIIKTIGSPTPNLIVLDSPLTAYSDVEEFEDGDIKISKNTITNFYESLERNYKHSQVIIIDNKDVPENINVNEIHFTKNKSFGRYGLFPVS